MCLLAAAAVVGSRANKRLVSVDPMKQRERQSSKYRLAYKCPRQNLVVGPKQAKVGGQKEEAPKEYMRHRSTRQQYWAVRWAKRTKLDKGSG